MEKEIEMSKAVARLVQGSHPVAVGIGSKETLRLVERGADAIDGPRALRFAAGTIDFASITLRLDENWSSGKIAADVLDDTQSVPARAVAGPKGLEVSKCVREVKATQELRIAKLLVVLVCQWGNPPNARAGR